MFRPRATDQETDTAVIYDFAIVEYGSGLDLLALALLMATFRDWFMICQKMIPFLYLCKYR